MQLHLASVSTQIENYNYVIRYFGGSAFFLIMIISILFTLFTCPSLFVYPLILNGISFPIITIITLITMNLLLLLCLLRLFRLFRLLRFRPNLLQGGNGKRTISPFCFLFSVMQCNRPVTVIALVARWNGGENIRNKRTINPFWFLFSVTHF